MNASVGMCELNVARGVDMGRIATSLRLRVSNGSDALRLPRRLGSVYCDDA